jgi:hypothetical protein
VPSVKATQVGEENISFRNSTIVTGSALGLMLALGRVNNASADNGGYGYAPKCGSGAYHGHHGGNRIPHYGYGSYSGATMRGHIPHPMCGSPGGAAHGYGYDTAKGKDGSCGG